MWLISLIEENYRYLLHTAGEISRWEPRPLKLGRGLERMMFVLGGDPHFALII